MAIKIKLPTYYIINPLNELSMQNGATQSLNLAVAAVYLHFMTLTYDIDLSKLIIFTMKNWI
jgi:hypothetical protein